MLQGNFLGRDGGVVEIGITEESFGGVGSGFEEVTLGSGELKIGFAHISEPAFGVESWGVIWRGFDGDLA